MRSIQRDGQGIARIIDNSLNPDRNAKTIGFYLFLFSFDGPEMTYLSNAERPDIIKMLEETIARWKKGEADQTWEKRS